MPRTPRPPATDPERSRITPDPPQWHGPTVLSQRWDQLASFHWRYPAADVARLLPDGLAVDTFDGDAWVGLIPFHMRGVRVGPTPPVPHLGSFVEINVRTYVLDRWGNRGVWFFSLDVPRAPIVGVARSLFSLPYCWGSASHEIVHDEQGEHHRYRCERRWPRPVDDLVPTTDIEYTVGDAVAPDAVSDLDHFVTARWSLFTVRRSRLMRGDVDHVRWPIHSVTQHRIDDTLVEAAGLPRPTGTPHALASPGVAVRVRWLQPVAQGAVER